MQVAEAIHKYAKATGITVLPIYGGASMVRIHRDDVAEAAEFFGDMSGQVWERIPVPAQHRPR